MRWYILLITIFLVLLSGSTWAGVVIGDYYEDAGAGGDTEESIAGATVFSSTWSAGSDADDALNTGGGANHVFDSETDAGDDLDKVESSSNGWDGSDDEYILYGSSNARAYVVADISDTGTVGVRVAFYFDAESISNGNAQSLMIFRNSNLENEVQLILEKVGGVLNFRADVKTDGGTENLDSGTVTTENWYQVFMKFEKNAEGSAGFAFRVYDDDANSWIDGADINCTGTTNNYDITEIRVGVTQAWSVTTTHRIDVFKVGNTFAYPDQKS